MFPLLQVDSAQAAEALRHSLTSHFGLLGGIVASAVLGSVMTHLSGAKKWLASHKWALPVLQIVLALGTTKAVAMGLPELGGAIGSIGAWLGVSAVTGLTSVGAFSAVKNTVQSLKTGG